MGADPDAVMRALDAVEACPRCAAERRAAWEAHMAGTADSPRTALAIRLAAIWLRCSEDRARLIWPQLPRQEEATLLAVADAAQAHADAQTEALRAEVARLRAHLAQIRTTGGDAEHMRGIARDALEGGRHD